ncbi:MAG: site-2 protease family protein [Bryobacteraceae bacterium]|nr:site-2 protease family protein [Bryobacteraceae bacterium]
MRWIPFDARLWLHGLLWLATLLTTSAAGARIAYNFTHNLPGFRLEDDLLAILDPLQRPALLLDGLPFAIALLLILGAHEFGHYYFCVRYGLNASLPYFLPAPTFIGTFGAFIRIRSLIYRRADLFDVGVAGPLAGFAALLPCMLFGLAHSRVIPGIAERGDMIFGQPLFLTLCEALIFPGTPSTDIALHPVARAAWVGLFATALNLLPIGQLDGGHILYAWFGEAYQRRSWLFLALLVPLGFFWWPWWIWAAILFWLGRKHPYIHDEQTLDSHRRNWAIAAVILFFLCFMPAPFRYTE